MVQMHPVRSFRRRDEQMSQQELAGASDPLWQRGGQRAHTVTRSPKPRVTDAQNKGDGAFMEPSRRNQWPPPAIGHPPKPLKQAKSVAVGCDWMVRRGSTVESVRGRGGPVQLPRARLKASSSSSSYRSSLRQERGSFVGHGVSSTWRTQESGCGTSGDRCAMPRQ
jgi:hypothetical protein